MVDIFKNSDKIDSELTNDLQYLLLQQRVQALRSLWDLRWHGENRAVAARTADPQVSACPIWTQAHVLCECPGSASARAAGTLDLTIAISHLTPGPMLALGRKLQLLLTTPNQPSLMARHWSWR